MQVPSERKKIDGRRIEMRTAEDVLTGYLHDASANHVAWNVHTTQWAQ